MKATMSSRWIRRIASLFFILSLCLTAAAQTGARRPSAADQKPLVEQARELLADGKAIQALSIARRAAQENPGDYKALYYVAYALMELGEAGEATRAAERSQSLASTPEAKAAVEQLQGTLSARGALKEADTAAAEGLYAKAGRLYQRAWEKGVLPPEKALVAADLFQNQLKDGATAARILRDLPARHAGTPLGDEAARRLVALRPALKDAAGDALAQAGKLEPGDPNRARWLRLVIDADPDTQGAQLMLTNDAAESGNWAALESQLKLLQRKGWLQGYLEGRSLVLGKWQNEPKLRTLLSDIWGEKRGAELLAMNTTEAQTLSPEAAQARALHIQAKNAAAFEAAGLKAGTRVAFSDCTNCPELLWLPAGTVPTRPETAGGIARWINKVRIGYPLAVGKFEITFDEWDACVAEGACRAVPEGVTPGTLFDTRWGRGRQPVINVHWNDAKAYTQWLSKKTGETYRLLSLAEYVYAARAGRAGDNLAATGANCLDCALRPVDPKTVPVGSFGANPWGLHDMVGNVSEMVADCTFDNADQDAFPVDGSPVRAPCVHRAPQAREYGGEDLVVMGGSWVQSFSGSGVPVGRGLERLPNTTMGFRVARVFTVK